MQEFPPVMPPELGQTPGDRLKKSMRWAGLSVADMAELCVVHRNTISGWIADRARPMKIFLRIWAETTGVPVQWLLDGTWPTECNEFERRDAPARTPSVKRNRPARRARRDTAG